MPESTQNVTTAQGLLHEVFHETLKQSFVSLGFDLFEYHQASGQYRNTVNNQPLGFDVVYPTLNYFEEVDHNFSTELPISTMIESVDPEVVAGPDSTQPGGSSNNSESIELLRVNPSTGEIISRYTLGYSSAGSQFFSVKNFLFSVPKTGQLLTINFRTSSYSGSGTNNQVSLSVSRSVYNFQAGTFSSGQHIVVVNHTYNGVSYPVSQVFRLDTGTTIEYFLFFLHTNLSNNNTSLRLLRVSYTKSNDNISASQIVLINDVNATSGGLVPPGMAQSWGSVYTSYTGDHHPGFGHLSSSLHIPYGFSTGKVDIPSSSFSGHILLQVRGRLPHNTLNVLFVKVPFSANINLSNFSASTVSFSLPDSTIYGPISIKEVYRNGYISQDGQRIHFQRKATNYTPPTNYQALIRTLPAPWVDSGIFIFHGSLAQERLSFSTFLYNRHSGANVYGMPFTVIVNREITPSEAFFVGTAFLDQTTLVRYFLSNPPFGFPTLMIGQVWTSDIYNSATSSSRIRRILVCFNRSFPSGTVFGSSLQNRNTQPYLIRIKNNHLFSYRMRTDLSNQDETVFAREDEVFLTGVMWTNMYQSGFFVPYMQIVKRGGDGVWFYPNKLYVGIASYDPSVRSPSFLFGVNGANVFWYRDVNDSSLHYMLGDQVNSTISLVTKLVVSPDRTAISLIGVQGANDLSFFRINIFGIDHLPTAIHYILPFANVVLGTSNLYEHVLPFSLNFPTLPYGARLKGKYNNLNIVRISGGFKNQEFYSFSHQNREITVTSYTRTTLSGNQLGPITTIWVEGFEGTSDIHGVTTRLFTALPDQTSCMLGVDTARTLRAGDYVSFTDQLGNNYTFVVVRTLDETYYNSYSGTGTSTFRTLLLVRKD